MTFQTFYHSPLGTLKINSTECGISSLQFVDKEEGENRMNAILQNCVKQLDEYFEKKRTEFSIPFDTIGTVFQKKVWKELVHIPFGKTISYLQLAIKLGDANTIRAVGGANGKNPVPIIVPCHRVIGSDGTLVGYSGGMDKKKWLLEFEGVLIQKELFV
jgi:methylated-DNA-[protein]-cysteine S-methyltransferase